MESTIYHSIQSSLDAQHWLLLFFGWLMYWLKAMNTVRMMQADKPFFTKFWADNSIEVPTSALACIVLAMMASGIPTDMIDMKGTLAVFLTGYSSSSILNGIITSAKPAPFKNSIPTNV